jgi:hypothetical protein
MYDYTPVKQPGQAFVDRVCSLLGYDREMNELFWKTPRRGTRDPKGGYPPAGTVRADGLVYVRVDGKAHLGHYLAYAVQTGRWPRGRVQFFNGDRRDWHIGNMCDTDWRNVATHEQLIAKGYVYPDVANQDKARIKWLESAILRAVGFDRALAEAQAYRDFRKTKEAKAIDNQPEFDAALAEYIEKTVDPVEQTNEETILEYLVYARNHDPDTLGDADAQRALAATYVMPQLRLGDLQWYLFGTYSWAADERLALVQQHWALAFPALPVPADLDQAVEQFHLLTKGPLS